MYWLRQYFSDVRSHMAALYEVAISAIFSLGPFYILYFVKSAKSASGDFANVPDLLGRGQLFLLAYGLYGTIFWLSFIRYDRPVHGARTFLGLIATLLIFPVLGFLGVDPTFGTILNDHVVKYGYFLYFALLIIQYLLLFYMNVRPPSAGEVLNAEAAELRRRYEIYEGSINHD